MMVGRSVAFGQIVIPLSAVPLAALAILIFLGNWDSFFCPSLVLNSPEKQTIPVVLNGLRSRSWSRYAMWAAGSMLTVVPVMMIYAFASRHFIRGIALTGLKG
jgi:multiple sugar transport system permease protein